MHKKFVEFGVRFRRRLPHKPNTKIIFCNNFAHPLRQAAMKTRFWILLVLAILCAGCASSQPAASTPADLPVTPTPSRPTATEFLPTAIPIVPTDTMAPVVEPTNVPEPTQAVHGSPLDPQSLETITDNLRTLLEAPDLVLTFQSMTTSPNASYNQAVLLVDHLGNSYYVRPDTFQPIEFTLEQPVHPSQGGSLTPDELLAAAEQLAARQSTRFERFKDRLVFTAGDKSGENYFYRWAFPDSDVGGMPATLQFGFKQDGSLFSYLNSLDYLP
jgi:hypothetical protein